MRRNLRHNITFNGGEFIMKKAIAVVLVLLMILSSFAGCSSGGTKAENVIKIGVFEPVTGENGGGGFQEVLGIRYANVVYPTVDIAGETYTCLLYTSPSPRDGL